MPRAMRVVESMHAPTKKTREQVVKLVACGLTVQEVSFVLGCLEHEVKEHYQREFEHGTAMVTGLVGGALLKNALKGDTNAQRAWLQFRARWTVPQHVELTEKDGGPIQVEARRTLIKQVLALATGDRGQATRDKAGQDGGQTPPVDGSGNPV